MPFFSSNHELSPRHCSAHNGQLFNLGNAGTRTPWFMYSCNPTRHSTIQDMIQNWTDVNSKVATKDLHLNKKKSWNNSPCYDCKLGKTWNWAKTKILLVCALPVRYRLLVQRPQELGEFSGCSGIAALHWRLLYQHAPCPVVLGFGWFCKFRAETSASVSGICASKVCLRLIIPTPGPYSNYYPLSLRYGLIWMG